MSKSSPRRWAEAGVRLLALAGLVAPSASAAEAGRRTPPDQAAILSAHAKLAAMGYPVGAGQSVWSRNSDYSVRRMLIRLGEEERSLTPTEAAARLRDIDPVAGPPCPQRPASRNSTVEGWRDVTVTFAGERPEEYLADFYLRLAECRPELLKPAPAPLPSRLAPASMISPGFPVSRTERSAASYRRLGSMLAKEIAFAGGDLSAPFAAPSLRVDVSSVLTSTAVDFSPTAAQASPNAEALDPICARFGYRRGCLDASAVELLADDGDASGAYLAHLDHFTLTLHLSLPQSEAARIVTDAIDAVRQRNKVMWGAAGRDLPRSYFGPPKAAPASVAFGKSLTDATLEEVNDGFRSLRAAVEWKSEAERARLLNASPPASKINVFIADPGFSFLRGDHHVSNTPRTDWGKLEALKPLAQVSGNQLVKVLADEGMQEDSLGHGLHVAYLASGVGQQGREGMSPVSGPDGFYYMNTDMANELATKSDLKAEDVDPYRGAVFNKSYKLLELCAAGEGISGVNYSTLVSGDREQLAGGAALQGAVVKRWFDVVSAPKADQVCPSECGAQSSSAPDNICAGKFATVLAVSPMEKDPKSVEWAPFKPGRIQYVKNIPMIGAPGAAIYSADMRMRDETEEFGFGKRDGSSMAAPVVTALVAHLRRIHGENLSWIDLKSWLFATATPLSDRVRNEAGNGDLSLHFGMVNFSRAMLGEPAQVNFYRKDGNQKTVAAGKVIWHAAFTAFREKSDHYGKGFAIVRSPDKADAWRRYWREKQARSCMTDSQPCFYFSANAYSLPPNRVVPGGCISSWNAQTAPPDQDQACVLADGAPVNFNEVERIVWLGALYETPYSAAFN